VDETALAGLRESFSKAIEFAQSQGAIGFDDQGRETWRAAYARLAERKPGLVGSMLARAEPQVRRLACLYALLDLSPVVRKEDLEAALELLKYVEETVKFAFGDSLGDATADEILLALQGAPEGLSRELIRKLVFQGHKSSTAINRALALLHGHALAHSRKVPTSGRPEVRWYAGPSSAAKVNTDTPGEQS